MARKSIISKYDWAQDPGVSITGAGGFYPELPAINMLNIEAQEVAQAIGSSVSFTINLGTFRSVGLIHLQRFVTGSDGTIEVVAGTYDSGVVGSWPIDVNGVYPPTLHAALGRQRVFIPPQPVVTDNVTFTIDAGSLAGQLQIGYIGICETVDIPGDMLVGNVTSVLDESQIDNVPFGSTFVTLRAKRRRLDFGMGGLNEANGNYYNIFDLALINGKSSPVVVCKFPDDTSNLERCTLWGTMTNDQPFTNTFYGHCDATFQLTQLV